HQSAERVHEGAHRNRRGLFVECRRLPDREIGQDTFVGPGSRRSDPGRAHRRVVVAELAALQRTVDRAIDIFLHGRKHRASHPVSPAGKRSTHGPTDTATARYPSWRSAVDIVYDA